MMGQCLHVGMPPKKAKGTKGKGATTVRNSSLVSDNPYPEVQSRVTLTSQWMFHTAFLTDLEQLEAILQAAPGRFAELGSGNTVRRIVREFCSKGPGTNRKLVDELVGLWEDPEGATKKEHVALSFLLLTKYDSADSLVALSQQLQDRAGRCSSARKQAVTLLVQRSMAAYRAKTTVDVTDWDALIPSAAGIDTGVAALTAISPGPAHARVALGPQAEALHHVLACVSEYLETHKMNAFKSSLQEPARLLFHLAHNGHHRDHVNVHGLNGYACVIRGGLGCQLGIIPLASDQDAFKGCGNHWAGLSEEAWEAFRDPAHFGKEMESILRCTKNQTTLLKDASFGSWNTQKFVGRNASVLERRAKANDPKLQPFVERFGYFFESPFLTRRMFEVLNAENDPAYSGFRAACAELFPLFALDHADAGSDASAAGSLVEFVYEDDYYTEINEARVAEWWRWLGVYKSAERETADCFRALANASSSCATSTPRSSIATNQAAADASTRSMEGLTQMFSSGVGVFGT